MYAFKEEHNSVLEDRVERIEERVGKIEERATKIEERVAKIEERAAKIESDVSHLRADQREFRQDFKTLANRFGDFQVEVAKRFGVVDASMEQLKRWVIVTGISGIVTLVGVLSTLIAMAHALKWF